MTISQTTNIVTYIGNGAQTVFTFPFPGVAPSDIQVIYTDINGNQSILPSISYTLTLNAPVTGQFYGVGGSVTYPISGSPIANGTLLTISRTLPLTQGTSLANQGSLWPQTVEGALDYLTMLAQQLSQAYGQAIVVPASDPKPTPLPVASKRANLGLLFDASGNPTVGSPLASGTVSLAMQGFINSASLANAEGTIGLFQTLTAATAATIDASIQFILTAGYASAGDGGGARYYKSGVTTTGGFTSADGAKWSLNEPILFAKMFGARANGTDDTAALQAWFNAMTSLNLPGFLNAGIYTVNGTITVVSSVPLTVRGAGGTDQFHPQVGSSIKATSASQTVLSITATAPVNFSDFDISGLAGATAGDLINITSSNNYNAGSTFFKMTFTNGFNAIRMITAALFQIEGCFFQAQSNTSVTIANSAVSDSGDMGIVNNTFFGPNTSGSTAILQTSAGGLRLVGNKISAYRFGYSCILSAGVSTSDLFISANSFESSVANSVGIVFASPAGTSFQTICITGNEIEAYTCISSASHSGSLLDVSITGNILIPVLAAGICINLGATTEAVTIVGNELNLVDTSGTGIGIIMSYSCVSVVVSGNSFINFNLAISQISNSFTCTGNNFNGLAGATGIALGASAINGLIADNSFINVTNPITGTSTSVYVHGNTGYNPLGAFAVTVGASPFVYTAGMSPETHYIFGGTVSLIQLGGGPAAASNPPSAATTTVHLEPHEAYVVTYSSTPNINRFVH